MIAFIVVSILIEHGIKLIRNKSYHINWLVATIKYYICIADSKEAREKKKKQVRN